MTDSAPFLSICMIVKNEESVIGRALASAAGLGAEVVVVDTGSTDRTVEIATAAGASVHHFPWVDDFSAARNHAFAHAHGAWMLVLDADEELQPELVRNIERVLRATRAGVLRVPLTSLDDGGRVQSTMLCARIVRNGCGYAYEGRIHEQTTDSVARAGGTIEDALDLPLLHHGYTSAETARKDRRQRNVKLLEAAHLSAPDEPRYWHYLALELVLLGDHARAALLLDRLLSRFPEHELAGWAASLLASIHEDERDLGTAWSVAQLGLGRPIGRSFCLTRVGRIALREGDADTAEWCASELERLRDDMATRDERLASAAELRAGARALAAPAAGKTRDLLVQLLAKYPQSSAIAGRLVDVCVAIGGKSKGLIDALRRGGNAPVVVSAAMHALAREGAWSSCVELGERSGVRNEVYPFALARVERAADARRELLALGDGAVTFAFVFGLAHHEEEVLARGLAVASSSVHASVLERVRSGGKVDPDHAWLVLQWLTCSVGLRADAVTTMLLGALPWKASRTAAFHALLRFESGDAMGALKLALENPTEPEASEVIGLVARAHGDHAAAASMLAIRARAGDAPVRVYREGADSLVRLGRRAEAEAFLVLGRESRPHARALGPTRSRAAA